MKRLATPLALAAAFCCQSYAPLAAAQDAHPLMSSKYWTNVGGYFASRDFDISVDGTVLGDNLELDFEREFGLDDGPDLFMAEFGWQFGAKWGVALQYFRSERARRKDLERTIEWGDLTFEAGISLRATSDMRITRVVVAREFRDGDRHSLRIGGGFHWLEVGASVSGEATLADMSTEFRTESVSAKAPVPNIAAWYRYTPSRRWLLSARVDWLSASVDEYSGGIWNASAGANLRFSDHFGAGVAYQFFQLDGSIRKNSWRGDIQTRFSGPHVFISAFW